MRWEQDPALLNDQYVKCDGLYDQMEIVRDQLRKRRGDERKALRRRYGHPNAQRCRRTESPST
ncbi:MAG: DUF2019 domain-containing protein [Pseudorhodoplanes sp.]|nr:DUF2019 domain-containing protein [Pseudorhodoplanes sp.]